MNSEIKPYSDKLLKSLELGRKFPIFGFENKKMCCHDNEFFLGQFIEMASFLEREADTIRVNGGWGKKLFDQTFQEKLSDLKKVRDNGGEEEKALAVYLRSGKKSTVEIEEVS